MLNGTCIVLLSMNRDSIVLFERENGHHGGEKQSPTKEVTNTPRFFRASFEARVLFDKHDQLV